MALNKNYLVQRLYRYKNRYTIQKDQPKKLRLNIMKNNLKTATEEADIFMDWPLNYLDKLERNYFANLIEKLIINSSEIGVKDIVIPFVDKSSIKSEEEMDCIVSFLDDFSILLNQEQSS